MRLPAEKRTLLCGERHIRLCRLQAATKGYDGFIVGKADLADLGEQTGEQAYPNDRCSALKTALPSTFAEPTDSFRSLAENPRQRFHRTSNVTTAPAAIFCPAPGFCDTTILAGVACGGGLAV